MQQTLRTVLVAVALLACGVIAEAQQAKKVWRIGYLSSTDRVADAYRFEPFRAALRDRGYIEGQNIVFEYRYSEGKRERQPELAAELARLNVDIILISGGGTVIRAAMNATKTIPILITGQGAIQLKKVLSGVSLVPAATSRVLRSLLLN